MAKAAAKNNKSKKTIKRTRFSGHGLLIFALLFAAVGGYLLLQSRAATPPSSPSIYLTPDTQTVNVGDTFTVNVYEDSGTDSVNAAQVQLSYPANELSYTGHTDSSAFSLSAENPSGDNGTLNFSRATCGGCTALSGSQLVVSITFKALSAGTATVDFLDSNNGTGGGTAVYLADGKGTPEPNLNMAGGTYTIPDTTPPSPPPSPTPTPTPTPPPSGGGTTTHSSGGTSSHITSPSPTSTTPAPSPTAAQPTQTASSGELTTTPSTPENIALIPTSVKHLLKIAGIALIIGAALSFAAWFLQHMRGRLHRFRPNYMPNTLATSPALPQAPVAPSITITPDTSKAAASSPDAKPQPGVVLQPNQSKKGS